MTLPLPTHTDRLTVCAPGEPPNKVAPHDGPLPAGAERLLWVGSVSLSIKQQTFTVAHLGRHDLASWTTPVPSTPVIEAG